MACEIPSVSLTVFWMSQTLLKGLFGLLLLLSVLGCRAGKPVWVSSYYRIHPLVGQIRNAQTGETVSRAELGDSLREAAYVLLGETHDNPDHHRLQAEMLEALAVDAGRPVVVFEQIPVDLDEALQSYLSDPDWTPTLLGPHVKWEERGWPSWSIYKPIAEVAKKYHIPLRAGNLSSSMLKAASRGDLSEMQKDFAFQEVLENPLPDVLNERLVTHVVDSHCGMLPKEAAPAVAFVQRVRDAMLADQLLRAQGSPSVLIAGAGHVRTDWGVPYYLRSKPDSGVIVSVAFMEVSEDLDRMEDYAKFYQSDKMPFDYVWFTPSSSIEDPCLKYKHSLEKLKAR